MHGACEDMDLEQQIMSLGAEGEMDFEKTNRSTRSKPTGLERLWR